MTDDNGTFQSSPLDALKRYVPLAVWAIVLLVILAIPLKIISYGYLPGDDALRHAAKAVSGKSWSQILVLNPVYKIDHEFGWNLFLEKIHRGTNWNAEALVIFSVVTLFVLVGWSVLPWLKWPEAWLITLLAASLTSDLCGRFTLGRPYLVTLAGLLTILFLWQRHGSSAPKWWMLWLTTVIFALCTFVHGAWYLWILLLGALLFAGEFRWAISLGFSWVIGVIIGSALTGHPFEYPVQALKLALLAVGMHDTIRTMASELQPSNGDIFALGILGGLIILRQLAKLDVRPLSKNPAFWLAFFGWVLGFKVGRFWADWGWPALMVLITCDLQFFLQTRFAVDSFKRLGLVFGVAIATFLAVTNDSGSRWTYNLTEQYLTENNPDLKGWMPDKGGIFYSADMTLFYQTFFKNPQGDWRYMLGFEPTWMPQEDFEVYHKVLWNFGDSKAYAGWVKKMRPQDRLVIRDGRGSPPSIPQLEWNYGVSGIWIGRLPRKNAPPPAPTVPATATLESLTNSVPETSVE
ncbi:MAG TPA: hypothetical protein VFC85_02210 [Verrucomicrobiae bacterium]|nr:hypothetical protein [Verrucomicrobiae bacterium]